MTGIGFAVSGAKHFSIRVFAIFAAALVSGHVFAWPMAEEIKRVQPDIQELMRPELDKVNSGRMNRSVFAEKVLAFEKDAESDAAKYILIKAAYTLFLQDKNYDRAADTIEFLKKVFPEAPEVEIEGWLDEATSAIANPSASRLREMRKIFKKKQADRQRSEKNKALAEKLRIELVGKTGGSPEINRKRRQLADAYAICGDWDKALEEFSKLGAKGAAIARYEVSSSGEDLYECGDFWWLYSEKKETDKDIFKNHAAGLYKKALASGVKLSPLKMRLVEKRIKEAEDPEDAPIPEADGPSPVATASAPSPAIKEASIKDVPVSNVSANNNSAWSFGADFSVPKVQKLRLPNGIDIAFCAIPPGTFNMSDIPLYDAEEKMIAQTLAPHRSKGYHRVTITRPFWISRTLLTLKQISAFLPDEKRDRTAAKFETMFPEYDIGTDQIFHNQYRVICHRLNEMYKHLLPEGYEFRMATEAELEYAVTQGGKVWPAYQGGWDLARNLCKEKGDDVLAAQREFAIHCCSRNPINDWGLQGYIPFRCIVHDRVRKTGWRNVHRNGKQKIHHPAALYVAMGYIDGEIDPVRWFGNIPLVRVNQKDRCLYNKYEDSWGFTRIVIGPKSLNVYPKRKPKNLKDIMPK